MPTEIPLQAQISTRSDVVSRTVEGEEVLLNLDSGIYFGLDEIGTAIWKNISKGLTPKDIISNITSEYNVPERDAERDVTTLLTKLEAKQLIEITR